MHCELFIADYFERLVTGKMLAVGMYPDRTIVLQVPAETSPPSNEQPYASDLSILLTLQDVPDGQHDSHVVIRPPGDGEPSQPLRLPTIKAVSGKSLNVIVNLKPLVIPSAGRYGVELHVGEEVATCHFEARIAPLTPASSTEPAAIASATDKPRARRRRPKT